jgi:hypothetical protein
MIGKDKKQQDLDQLERFILEPKISEYFTHLWYSSLRNKYPFQYLQLLKKHRNGKKDSIELEVDDDRINVAINWLSSMRALLNKYIIVPPEDDDQNREFDMLITRLEELLLKQNKEN